MCFIFRPEPLGGCGEEEETAQEYGFLPSQNTPQNGHYGHTGTGNRPILPESNDRESRRILRVKRELERIQEAENEDKDEERFELLEFAQNYFNEHEKSPNGTIVGTLKRSKTIEMLSKNDMISYYKGNSIPNSHIHMFDPENINIACNIFKDLIKYAKGKFHKTST